MNGFSNLIHQILGNMHKMKIFNFFLWEFSIFILLHMIAGKFGKNLQAWLAIIVKPLGWPLSPLGWFA